MQSLSSKLGQRQAVRGAQFAARQRTVLPIVHATAPQQAAGKQASENGSSNPIPLSVTRDVSVNVSRSLSSMDKAMETSIASTDAWRALQEHVAEIENTHLKDLLADQARCEALTKEDLGLYIDFSRQRATHDTVKKLMDLARAANLKEKIDAMYAGDHINSTEDRAVLHVATRARREQVICDEGKNQVPEVWAVLDRIKAFSEKVRSGEWKGATGKPIKNIVAIGIGGSFLGPLFVHTALRTEPHAMMQSRGRTLRFLANVDPIDVARALNGLDPEETMAVVISKTFTTAETMLNARTVRSWLTSQLGEDAVAQHMVAVSTNLKLVKEFGIDPENAFGFWDWVGGRYSVCSAVGILPLSLQYGFEVMEQFLAGANAMDDHFRETPLESNLPVLMGLLSVWNISFMGYPARAILPYCQALSKLAPHIQQVSMESNGKGVDINGNVLPFEAGEIDFGEPGTNGQHSFYQLIHQGRVVPCDFIGIVRSQQSVYLKDEIVSNHDELMCNFFAQADALAYGKSREELRSQNVPDFLIPHRSFTGNRPSTSLLLPELSAYTVGQVLALYEHQVAVQGFIWNINSFDQWGVELGKVLASRVRQMINQSRNKHRFVNNSDGFNYSTTRLLNKYLQGKTQLLYPEPRDVFPAELLEHNPL
ncbi:phosphoglucose isomerase [Scenedesmus sp. NREL 46B-D3]|nr:phosphoglucose isomerase [Scenedesmus sp. NREL 46B-D3]